MFRMPQRPNRESAAAIPQFLHRRAPHAWKSGRGRKDRRDGGDGHANASRRRSNSVGISITGNVSVGLNGRERLPCERPEGDSDGSAAQPEQHLFGQQLPASRKRPAPSATRTAISVRRARSAHEKACDVRHGDQEHEHDDQAHHLRCQHQRRLEIRVHRRRAKRDQLSRDRDSPPETPAGASSTSTSPPPVPAARRRHQPAARSS